ncbi:MAG: NAD(P)-dependent glycerol-3-phosphate dehydrogenase [Deltaproteobacteria bacterium]|nr:NAD(P)-dependent glycerol-3-phosphate dehydrogenase [Deltaproteobacteria bacterium]MBW2417537.1 NAD(P)-dependent glycerol-3-phosphate dehydrogenase [Deltaproteobacteria bacterium]
MAIPVGVIGAGSFGTCLALLCARENDVTIWSRNPDLVEGINRDRRNPRYLKDIDLPESVRATTELAECIEDKELVICAVPSHGLRDVIAKAAPILSPDAILVSAVKGIECESGMTMHQVLCDVLPEHHHPRIVCLSGPSFAREIAQHKPTVVTLACHEEAYAISVQSTLSCPWFRCYSHTDVIGVELGGALKNVIAIAIGIGDGMRQGHNSRAALMTRGLAEITRLGLRLGADPTTFLGLSGMGDLVLTCTGDLSRNRRVGLALGEGRQLDDIIEELGEVAEGVRTTRAVCRLAARLGVDMPIANMVRQVIDGESTPADAGRTLMTRQLRSEFD